MRREQYSTLWNQFDKSDVCLGLQPEANLSPYFLLLISQSIVQRFWSGGLQSVRPPFSPNHMVLYVQYSLLIIEACVNVTFSSLLSLGVQSPCGHSPQHQCAVIRLWPTTYSWIAHQMDIGTSLERRYN